MEIKSLTHTDFDTIFHAFSEAFAGYEMQLDKQQLQVMFTRRGFDANLSFAAFEGKKIVAFTCNGIGYFESTPTAYDTGTGTLKEYRGKGLATQIFEYSIPHLQANGITRYLLEVLQHNTKAVSVYRNLGFLVSREFNYFRQDNNFVENKTTTPSIPYQIKPIQIEDFKTIIPSFWDFTPSWQNSLESVNRAPADFITLGIFTVNQLIAYSVFEPANGDITQIAVDKKYRRKGFGSLLLSRMLEANKYPFLKVINTEIGCESITRFLQVHNIIIRGKQFEMIKELKKV